MTRYDLDWDYRKQQIEESIDEIIDYDESENKETLIIMKEMLKIAKLKSIVNGTGDDNHEW